MKCSYCKQSVIQKSADGGINLRLKGAIHVPASGGISGNCYWCGTKVQLPVELKKSQAGERFALNIDPRNQ